MDADGVRMLEIQLNYHRREPENGRPAMYRYFVYHYTLVTDDSDSSIHMQSFCPFETTGRTAWSCDKGYRRSNKIEDMLRADFSFWTQKLVAEHCQKFGLPCPCLD